MFSRSLFTPRFDELEGRSSSRSSSSDIVRGPINVPNLFNSSETPSKAGSAPSSATQQVALLSVPHHITLSLNKDGESEIVFEIVTCGLREEPWTPSHGPTIFRPVAAISKRQCVSRTIVPQVASDLRAVPFSESQCLLVVRLCSGDWAMVIAESTPEGACFGEWTIVPRSIQEPVVEFVSSDGQTLKISGRNSSVPIFIGKYSDLLSEAYATAAELVEANELEIQELRKQVAKKTIELSKEAAQAKEEAAQAMAEAAKLQSYLIKQENGMDAVLLELAFGKPAESSPLVDRCKSILESHLSSSMSELRCICSSASSLSISKPSSSAPAPGGDAVIDWKSLIIGREIGQGGFGSVFACELKMADGQKRPVALKAPARQFREALPSVQKQAQESSSMSSAEMTVIRSIQNEIVTYKRLDHPNVVRYLGCTVEPSSASSICIVQQYCAAGDLQSLLSTKPMSSEKFAFQAAMQIASGMSAVHSLGVAHRDLKPANVLLCSFPASSSVDMTVCKIGDCGSATLKDLNNELSKITGSVVFGATAVNGFTSRYSPPELLTKRLIVEWKESYAQDIWAFGLLLFQLRTGKIPFEDDKEQTVIGSILSGEEPGVWPQEDGQQWDWLRSLAFQCLESQPRDRLAHFEAMGASADGRTAFSTIEKMLCEARPEWAKEVMANMLKFQRMEIRDPFLKDQAQQAE